MNPMEESAMPDKPMYERAEDLQFAIIVFTDEGVNTITDAQRLLERVRDKARQPKNPRKRRT